MTVCSQRAATTVHRFDRPLRPVIVSRQSAQDPSRAVLAGDDGQYWLVEVEDIASTAPPRVVAVSLDLTANDRVAELCELIGPRILASTNRGRGDRHEVHDIGTGEIVFAAPVSDCAAMTPDGTHLLLMTDEGIGLVDLTRPEEGARKTGLFLVGGGGESGPTEAPEHHAVMLDNPGSAMTAASSPDASRFTLAIGDYGFAVVAELRIDPAAERPLMQTRPPRMLSEGLVYDPVDVVDIDPACGLVVRHGSGCGLARFDLASGTRFDCPLPAAMPEPRYAAFRRIVPARGSQGIWVQTDIGPHYWDGEGELRPLQDDAGEALATDGTCFLGLSADGRALVHGRL